jgi:hypothetical protein
MAAVEVFDEEPLRDPPRPLLRLRRDQYPAKAERGPRRAKNIGEIFLT